MHFQNTICAYIFVFAKGFTQSSRASHVNWFLLFTVFQRKRRTIQISFGIDYATHSINSCYVRSYVISGQLVCLHFSATTDAIKSENVTPHFPQTGMQATLSIPIYPHKKSENKKNSLKIVYFFHIQAHHYYKDVARARTTGQAEKSPFGLESPMQWYGSSVHVCRKLNQLLNMHTLIVPSLSLCLLTKHFGEIFSHSRTISH